MVLLVIDIYFYNIWNCIKFVFFTNSCKCKRKKIKK